MTKFIAILAIAGSFISCRGKEEKPNEETTPTENTTGTQESPAIDSTAMSFDPAGSDSGKIDGLKTVFFDYDKSTLSAEAKRTIQGNVDWMKKNANTKVQIEGHCDNRGSIEYNVALGERRANTVKDYMVSLGLSGNRLATISYGEEKPLVSSESESAWKKNRRANFVPSAM
ncbi:MAG: peptidoglycan-associated lipoprotein Pal [Bdellovibrionaceae bacterium]|nr:peptidoglycan-associated lipoprotein Pal [Pseudobdellovibrionaceae bacterium]